MMPYRAQIANEGGLWGWRRAHFSQDLGRKRAPQVAIVLKNPSANAPDISERG